MHRREEIDRIPSAARNEAARFVIDAKRKETGISDWLPKLLNGSREFEQRVIERVKAQGCGCGGLLE
jgi:vacuolar-type H+-ATPase subunit E/Vma4